jgi:hypothetical protein
MRGMLQDRKGELERARMETATAAWIERSQDS